MKSARFKYCDIVGQFRKNDLQKNSKKVGIDCKSRIAIAVLFIKVIQWILCNQLWC